MKIRNGVVPVMLTPFNDDKSVDYSSLARLVDWYIDEGVSGLFTICQSSEMAYLSDKEAIEVATFVVKQTNGRVPVVASGHTADTIEAQKKQMAEMVKTGVDGLVFITNRLGHEGASDAAIIEHMESLMESIPENISIGLYECPLPWKRLMSDDLIKYCAQSGRFSFLKDTCCSADILERRLSITKDTDFKIYNANAATLLTSLRLGASGYSGIMANFHCDQYVWLCKHFEEKKAVPISAMLSIASLAEHVAYPASAKYHQKKIGNFNTTTCRCMDDKNFYQEANVELIDYLQLLTMQYQH